MSTSGKEKWEKYFKGKDVTTKLRSDAPIYDAAGNVIDLAATPRVIHVPAADSYSPRYFIEYDGKQGYVAERYVAKPFLTFGSTENLQIHSKHLTKYGEPRRMHFQSANVEVMYFSKETYLANSIFSGLRENPNVSETIEGTFARYFDSMRWDRIEWCGEERATDINELGKYLGEVIVGLMTLSSNVATYFDKSFQAGDVQGFAVPTSANFNGYDSFLVMKNDEVIGQKIAPISNKYGLGASTAFITNVLPKIDMSEITDHAVVKKFDKYVKTSKTSKEALYKYGVHEILGIDWPNPYELYFHILNNVDSEITRMVIERIRATDCDQSIKDALPFSTTFFFGKVLAQRIMACHASMAAIRRVFSDNNYIQARLDPDLWRAGHVRYSIQDADKSTFKVAYQKSAIADVTAKQGLISYYING